TKSPSATLPSPVSFNTTTNALALTNLDAAANGAGCQNVTTTCAALLDGNTIPNWGGDLLGSNSQFVNDVGFKVTGVNGNTMNVYAFAPGARGQPMTTTLLTTVSLNNGSLVVGPVPEPSTYALMVAGLLTVGAVARRRMRG